MTVTGNWANQHALGDAVVSEDAEAHRLTLPEEHMDAAE
jgi:hypothetical protein